MHSWLWRPVHHRCTSHTPLDMAIYMKIDVRTWSRVVSCFHLSEIPQLIQDRYFAVNCVWWNTTFAGAPRIPFSPYEFRTFQRRNNLDGTPLRYFRSFIFAFVKLCHPVSYRKTWFWAESRVSKRSNALKESIVWPST